MPPRTASRPAVRRRSRGRKRGRSVRSWGTPLARSGAAPTRSYPLYIAGKDVDGDGWVYTVSGRSLLEDVFTSVSLKRSLERDPDSPLAGHPYVVGRCAVAGDDMIDDLAAEAAAAAAPGWAALPLDHRMQLGTRFREELIGRSQEFLKMLTDEAHPSKLARWELSCLLQIYSEESLGWYRQQMHTEFRYSTRRLIVRRQPDGVVAFNPPQNAPLPSAALAVLCLMAGNAVVMRAPRSIALSTMWLMRDVVAPLLDELGAPPGTLNAVCSNPKQTMDRWVASPLINDIFYIGGSTEGLRFEQECVAHGKKPILELAGNDGMVVWHDADIPRLPRRSPRRSTAPDRSAWSPTTCWLTRRSPPSCSPSSRSRWPGSARATRRTRTYCCPRPGATSRAGILCDWPGARDRARRASRTCIVSAARTFRMFGESMAGTWD